MDYKNGQIYVIRSYKTDKIYVGATCSPLYKRFYKHKQEYKRWLKTTEKYMSSFEIIKYGDAYIELYEKYPCSCKNELRKKEGETIRKLNCVNKNIAGRDKKQYRQDNLERIKIRDKKYNKDNRDKRNEYARQYYQDKRQQILEDKKQYNIDNQEKIAERRKNYYQNNRQKILEKKKIYQEKNKERINKYQKEYRQKNLELIRAKDRERGQKRKWKRRFNKVLKNIK